MYIKKNIFYQQNLLFQVDLSKRAAAHIIIRKIARLIKKKTPFNIQTVVLLGPIYCFDKDTELPVR